MRKKCTKLVFEKHRPTENLLVVAAPVVPSAPLSSLTLS